MYHKTITIIQARMGSKRLPGKILKTIADKTIIEHVITNLQQCQKIDKIYLATGSGNENHPLQPICEKHNITLYFGPEDNVLQRFWDVLEKEKKEGRIYDSVVRICADSPFIDAKEIDKLIKAHNRKKADLSINYNHQTGLPCGFGVEVISSNALQESHQLAKTNEHKEHLDEWILQHPNRYKIYKHPVPKNKQNYRLHFTVDYPEDLSFLQQVTEYLKQQNLPIYSQNILAATQKNISLLAARRLNLFIRADGNGEIGMGHIMRCLTIADAITQIIPATNTTFYTNQESVNFIQNAGYNAKIYSDETITANLKDINPDMIIIDLRKHLDDASSLPLSRALRIRFIDSEKQQQIRGDLIINSYPLKDMNTSCPYFAGLNYLPLRKEFSKIEKKYISNTPKEILVMLGAGDLHTSQLIKIIETAKKYPNLQYTIITGIAMSSHNQTMLQNAAMGFKNIILRQNIQNVTEYMQKADIAISGGGNTLFEFARCGTPVISISTDYDSTHSSHQEHYCQAFQNANTSIYLGHNTNWTAEELQKLMQRLIENKEQRTAMSKACQKLIDGRATSRIIKHILQSYVKK